MEVKRRVVVVGLGSIGRRHARLLAEREDVVVELADPDPAVRRLFAMDGFSSFDDALASKPDVMWICSPTSLHAAQTIASLDAGCDVFCEKPMSDSLDAARRMKLAADRSGRVLNIGFHLHFWEGAIRMKRLLDTGALGEILHVHARVGTYITLVNSQSRYQAACPGSLFLDYSHQPDLFYWWLNEAPASVFAYGLRGGAMEFSSNPNVADIVCRFASGKQATIHLNYAQMPERHYYEVTGDQGWAFADLNAGYLTIGNRSSQTIAQETFTQDKDAMIRDEQQAFFDALEGRCKPSTSAVEGLVSTAVCEAIHQSWLTQTAQTPGEQ
jgi:predicted dehydrogenase